MVAEDPSVDAFVSRAGAWQGTIEKLRSILLGSGLDEQLKWGKGLHEKVNSVERAHYAPA